MKKLVHDIKSFINESLKEISSDLNAAMQTDEFKEILAKGFVVKSSQAQLSNGTLILKCNQIAQFALFGKTGYIRKQATPTSNFGVIAHWDLRGIEYWKTAFEFILTKINVEDGSTNKKKQKEHREAIKDLISEHLTSLNLSKSDVEILKKFITKNPTHVVEKSLKEELINNIAIVDDKLRIAVSSFKYIKINYTELLNTSYKLDVTLSLVFLKGYMNYFKQDSPHDDRVELVFKVNNNSTSDVNFSIRDINRSVNITLEPYTSHEVTSRIFLEFHQGNGMIINLKSDFKHVFPISFDLNDTTQLELNSFTENTKIHIFTMNQTEIKTNLKVENFVFNSKNLPYEKQYYVKLINNQNSDHSIDIETHRQINNLW